MVTLKIKCPKCDHQFTHSAPEIHAGDVVPCPGCGLGFKFEKKTIDDANRAIKKEVEKALKGLGKVTWKR